MRPKEILRQLLPPILISIKRKLSGRQQTKEEIITTTKEIRPSSDTLIVIGNGPSLTSSMQKYGEFLATKDCIVVNHFCETPLYDTLKPRYYLLADPAYWGDIDSYADWLKTKITNFTNTLVERTTWDINLIVPSSAMGSRFVSIIEQNPYIHTFFYNNKHSQSAAGMSKFDAWDKNLIPPPAQTVLNTCVWLGIYLRYKDVYLIGADTSWIELLRVDQETNMLYSVDSHFYGKKKIPLYADVGGKVPQKLHENLNCISRALSKYWELKEYADYSEVNVYNASEYSLIDAFERKKPY